MAITRFPVPLPEPLAQAVQAEAVRTRLPVRTVIAAFFLDRWSGWQGERMNRDLADLREVMSIDELLPPTPGT